MILHPPIYSTFAEDEDMAELIEMFVNDVPDKIVVIENLLASEDWDALKRLAHQLKGAAGGYGFSAITPCAQSLEATLETPDDIALVHAQAKDLVTLLAAIRMR